MINILQIEDSLKIPQYNGEEFQGYDHKINFFKLEKNEEKLLTSSHLNNVSNPYVVNHFSTCLREIPGFVSYKNQSRTTPNQIFEVSIEEILLDLLCLHKQKTLNYLHYYFIRSLLKKVEGVEGADEIYNFQKSFIEFINNRTIFSHVVGILDWFWKNLPHGLSHRTISNPKVVKSFISEFWVGSDYDVYLGLSPSASGSFMKELFIAKSTFTDKEPWSFDRADTDTIDCICQGEMDHYQFNFYKYETYFELFNASWDLSFQEGFNLKRLANVENALNKIEARA